MPALAQAFMKVTMKARATIARCFAVFSMALAIFTSHGGGGAMDLQNLSRRTSWRRKRIRLTSIRSRRSRQSNIGITFE